MSLILDLLSKNFHILILAAFIILVVRFFYFLNNRYLWQSKYLNESPIPFPPQKSIIYGHLKEYPENHTSISWHKRFGRIVGFFNCDKIGIKINDLSLIEQVFVRQTKNFEARIKDYRLSAITRSILFNRGDRWRLIRKLVQPALYQYRTQRESDSKETIVNGEINKSKSRQSQVRDIHCGLDRLMNHFEKRLTKVQEKDNKYLEKLSKTFNINSNDPNIQELLAKKRPHLKITADDVVRGYHVAPQVDDNKKLAMRVNVRSIMQTLTLDMIFRIGYNNTSIDVTECGRDPNVQLAIAVVGSSDKWLYKLAMAVPLSRFFLVPYIIFLDPEIRLYFKLSRLLHSQMKTNTESQGDSYTKNPDNEQPRRISNILTDALKQNLLTRQEFNSNTIALLVAGFETTATTATYMTWCMANFPDLQTKLRSSILESGIQSDYLDMFVKETMRMFPALPNFVTRTPYEDTTLAGYEIRKGTHVHMSVIAVHYDPEIWPDPYKFDPERFARGKTIPVAAYAPFGLGHRKCAGMHLAMHELKAIACALMRRYRVRLIAPEEMIVNSTSVFLTKPKYDVVVDLEPLGGIEDLCEPAADDDSEQKSTLIQDDSLPETGRTQTRQPRKLERVSTSFL